MGIDFFQWLRDKVEFVVVCNYYLFGYFFNCFCIIGGDGIKGQSFYLVVEYYDVVIGESLVNWIVGINWINDDISYVLSLELQDIVSFGILIIISIGEDYLVICLIKNC